MHSTLRLELGSICMFVFSFQILPAFGGEAMTRVNSKPTQVTVYPNGARVVREGSIDLKEGPQTVLFSDLPASTLENSLRLSVEGPKGTRYFGVAIKKEFTDHVVDVRTRKIRDQIQRLQDQRTDISDKIESTRTEINILKSYGTGGGRKGQAAANINEFTDSASKISKRIATLTAESRKLEREIRGIDLKIGALNSQLAQGRTGGMAGAMEKRTAQADLDLKQSGTVRFKLSYQVQGASWAPVYDLNLDTKGEKPLLELGFNGNIRQNSGEDWKGVSLTLSTARPTENTQAPDPTQWWLNYYTVQTQLYRRTRGMAPAPAAAVQDQAVAEKMVRGKAAELEPAELELAKTIQATYSVNYSITVSKDIPSDGSDHRVGILQSQYPVNLSIVVVPRLSLSSFIEANVNYGGEQILLPGPAQLFRDGEFVGNTNLMAKAPGESFELGFGQDDLIRTERKKGEMKSTKGERNNQWTITVSNFHTNTQTVEVREQLPRTQQKEIKVEATETTPPPLPDNPEKPGLIVWRMEVKPKDKALINFSYRVRYPENMELPGLE